VIALFAAALMPLGDRWMPPEVPPGSGTWHLPDGGSLAYGAVHAADGAPGATPVVVLHGGPGVPDTAGPLRVLGPLAEAGHDVWAYDQRGTGRSSRLTDPRGYTTALGVADLEHVHERIGAERLILVGHSYGAYLAAAYIAEHPDRVERAVFLSPGDLRNDGTHGSPQDRLTSAERVQLYRLLVSPRALLAYALVQVDREPFSPTPWFRSTRSRRAPLPETGRSTPARTVSTPRRCPACTAGAAPGLPCTAWASTPPPFRSRGAGRPNPTSHPSSDEAISPSSSSRASATISTGSRPPTTCAASRTAACSTFPVRGRTFRSTKQSG